MGGQLIKNAPTKNPQRLMTVSVQAVQADQLSDYRSVVSIEKWRELICCRMANHAVTSVIKKT
jgi:hypothetical protein